MGDAVASVWDAAVRRAEVFLCRKAVTVFSQETDYLKLIRNGN